MSFEFTPLASLELQNAAHDYEDKCPGLGSDFRREVTRCLSWLVIYPKSAPPVDAVFRRKPIARFPFAIVYAVRRNRILVTGIVPTRANPEQLSGRLSPPDA